MKHEAIQRLKQFTSPFYMNENGTFVQPVMTLDGWHWIQNFA